MPPAIECLPHLTQQQKSALVHKHPFAAGPTRVCSRVFCFHPRFLIEQTKAICAFEEVPPQFRPDFLRRAWGNLFISE